MSPTKDAQEKSSTAKMLTLHPTATPVTGICAILWWFALSEADPRELPQLNFHLGQLQYLYMC